MKSKINSFFNKIKSLFKKNEDKYAGLSEEEIVELKHQEKKKRDAVIDKITTGILIFLMASPVLILGYIFIWFIFNLQQ